MKPGERDPLLYLEDMLLSMERLQEYIKELDVQQFKLDYKTVDAVIRNFEIIDEASKNLPQALKNKYNHIPWDGMYRLRNRISHEYFGIDYDIVWDIATRQLPSNYKDLREVFELEQSFR